MTRHDLVVAAATATVLTLLGLAWVEFVYRIGAMR